MKKSVSAVVELRTIWHNLHPSVVSVMHISLKYLYNPGIIPASDNIKCFILKLFSGNTLNIFVTKYMLVMCNVYKVDHI